MNRKKAIRILLEIIRYVIIIFGAFWMILPFFWLFSASLMSPQELMSNVPKWLAEKPRTKPVPLYNAEFDALFEPLCYEYPTCQITLKWKKVRQDKNFHVYSPQQTSPRNVD